MERKRLRPSLSCQELERVYRTPHDHTRWTDHRLRVAVTTEVAKWLTQPGARVADLSCGDAAVAKALDASELHLGDFAAGYTYRGPIEETIHVIPQADLLICAETIEHLDDPDSVLADIRGKTEHLVLSTPVDAWDDDNPQHYWAWSRTGVETMLHAAGFQVTTYVAVDLRPMGRQYYQFGVWGCR